MRPFTRRRSKILLATLLPVLVCAFTALPVPSAQAAAQGAPARPSPGPSPDPALPVHTLARADSPLDNPLKGFARFYQPGNNQNTGYPHSLTWSYFGLSEVMKDASDCGHYDWSILDNALNETASYGNQAAIRFYLEYPGGSGTHPANAIPPCFDGHVTYRTNTYWNTVSPDYDSTYLLDGLKNFIAAFGARYDNDPRIGFIHMGLIGLWGEWHTWPYDTDTSGDSYPNYMPTDAHGAQVMQAYASAFPHTKLEVRYPESAGGAASALPSVGFHDDSFCFREGNPLAGVTLPMSMGGASYAQLQKALDHGVENRWITASMGGEVRPEIQSTAFSAWPGGSGAVDNMKACLELEHTTWKINEGSSGYSPTDPNVGAAVRLMGYDLGVDRAYYQDSAQGNTTVGVQISNSGVAPFYYPWKVDLGLQNASGAIVKTWATSWDLRTVMPAKIRAFPDWGKGADPTYLDYGYPRYFSAQMDLSGVASGGYRVVMKAVNPLEATSANAKKLRFANAGQRADGWLDLGAMTVGAGGGGRSYEAEAAGNTLSGTAVVAGCAACSGGAKVGYLGNGANLTFTHVDGGTGGTRTVTVRYASAVARTATIRANSTAGTVVTFAPTADWTTPGSTTVALTLQAGTENTITIGNPSDWAPDIDSIAVT
ncbi:carbohydrate-binding protein [Amycolatopsis sp. cmx-4-68]|uniref:carbohydrate-binding protein n=1 Tax=Amycolatopsis sp. cmx-4-68 TaxID=2790938 RepID=UPI00397CEED6